MKITPQQQEQVDRLPPFANREYVEIRMANKDYPVMARALAKLGYHWEYSGGRMLVWKHEETILQSLARRRMRLLYRNAERCAPWQKMRCEDYVIELRWLFKKFSEVEILIQGPDVGDGFKFLRRLACLRFGHIGV